MLIEWSSFVIGAPPSGYEIIILKLYKELQHYIFIFLLSAMFYKQFDWYHVIHEDIVSSLSCCPTRFWNKQIKQMLN